MNKFSKTVCVILLALFLLALTLACGVVPAPTPTPTNTPTPTSTPTPTPTPTPPPTPTPTPEPLGKTYANDDLGFQIDYPKNWQYMEDELDIGYVVLFSSRGDDAAVAIVVVPLEDSDADLDELFEQGVNNITDPNTEIGDPELTRIGGEDALIAPVTTDDAEGWLAIVVSHGYQYTMVIFAQKGEMEEYEAQLMAMLDSIEFY